jgi:hypothetical protein
VVVVDPANTPTVAKVASGAQDLGDPAPGTPPSTRTEGRGGNVLAIPDVPGVNLKPDPTTAHSGAEFVGLMRQLRIWAGQPSLRMLAGRAPAKLPISSLSIALKSTELPRLDLVLTFIRACGCTEDDASRWATAWRMIALQTAGQAAKQQKPNQAHRRIPGGDSRPHESSYDRWAY